MGNNGWDMGISDSVSGITVPWVGFSISFSFTLDNRDWGTEVGAMFAGYFLAQFFVFDGLSDDFLGFTYGFGSWCAYLGYEFFVFNGAVWCNGKWGGDWSGDGGSSESVWGSYSSETGSYCWGSEKTSSYESTSQQQLWVGFSFSFSFSISSWCSIADSQEARKEEYLGWKKGRTHYLFVHSILCIHAYFVGFQDQL